MRFAPDSGRYVVPPFLLAALLAFVAPPLGAAALAVGAFVAWFFRDPERTPPPDGIVSPADGRVSVVRLEGDRVRVGVFMNVTDVHVNRAPMAGTVGTVDHRPGANKPAFSKESARNERVDVAFDGFDVSLIAGWFARRIHPYVEPGDVVARGDRIGHIAFGSRADVLLPPTVSLADVDVETGDTVRAGETVLATQ